MDTYFVTVYGDDGKVLFTKSGEDLSALTDVVQQGVVKNDAYRIQLKAIAKYKEIRIVFEERCTTCGVMHVISEIQDIL